MQCLNSVHNYEKIKTELEDVQAKVAAGDFEEATLDMLSSLETEFDRIGGYSVEGRIVGVLKGLSFKDEDTERLCSSFSGGWQMRVSLCKVRACETRRNIKYLTCFSIASNSMTATSFKTHSLAVATHQQPRLHDLR